MSSDIAGGRRASTAVILKGHAREFEGVFVEAGERRECQAWAVNMCYSLLWHRVAKCGRVRVRAAFGRMRAGPTGQDGRAAPDERRGGGAA